jgi:hypothetical protein
MQEPAARSERPGARRYRDAAFDHGIDCPEKTAPAEAPEGELIQFPSQFRITDEIKDMVLQKLGVTFDPGRAKKQRAALLRRFERVKTLFKMGDLSEAEYLRDKERINGALAQIQPAAKPEVNLQRAIELLETLGRAVEHATDAERKQLFAAVLSAAYVENKKIVAVRPRPNYYDLLMMSPVRPNGDIHTTYKQNCGLGRRAGDKPGLLLVLLTKDRVTTKDRFLLRNFAFSPLGTALAEPRPGLLAMRTIGGMVAALAITQNG